MLKFVYSVGRFNCISHYAGLGRDGQLVGLPVSERSGDTRSSLDEVKREVRSGWSQTLGRACIYPRCAALMRAVSTTKRARLFDDNNRYGNMRERT